MFSSCSLTLNVQYLMLDNSSIVTGVYLFRSDGLFYSVVSRTGATIRSMKQLPRMQTSEGPSTDLWRAHICADYLTLSVVFCFFIPILALVLVESIFKCLCPFCIFRYHMSFIPVKTVYHWMWLIYFVIEMFWT